MTYRPLFNLICIMSVSALLASVMVQAQDTVSPSSSQDSHRHQHPGPHGHSKGAGNRSAGIQPGINWAKHLNLQGAKASAVADAELRYHDRRRELKKKHYAEMMALEKDKLKSLEQVLNKQELAKLQALWVQQLRDEHQQHGSH